MSVGAELLRGAPERVGALAVRRLGQGPALVLVHGGVGSASHWVANVEALSRRFTLAVVDLPGYGDAAAPASREADAYLREVLAAFREIIDGGGAFDLAGFSFGAVIAAAVARDLGERVRALSLLGPGGFGVPAGRDVTLLPVPRAAEDPAGHAAAVAHNLGSFMLSRAPAPHDPVVRLQSENIARARFDSRRISFQDRLADDLRAVRCPVQLIWGAADRLPVPSIAARIERLRAARPDAEFHVIPEAGHWVQFEAPAAVDALLIDFHERVAR